MKDIKVSHVWIRIVALAIISFACFFSLYRVKKAYRKGEQQAAVFVKTQKDNFGPSYDFGNMVLLIEKSRKFEYLFYSNFDILKNDKKSIKELEFLHEEFKVEKSFFDKYVKKIRSYYSAKAMPDKKNNSLRYYMRVFETKMSCIEKILKRIDVEFDAKKSN